MTPRQLKLPAECLTISGQVNAENPQPTIIAKNEHGRSHLFAAPAIEGWATPTPRRFPPPWTVEETQITSRSPKAIIYAALDLVIDDVCLVL